jgi:cytochrome c6
MEAGRLQKNPMLRLIRSREALRRLAVLILVGLTLPTYTIAESADAYKAKCSACHGGDGAGQTLIGRNLKLRSLGSPEVQKLSDDELFVVISKGKGKMPAFDHKLSQDQIRDLVRHVRALKK